MVEKIWGRHTSFPEKVFVPVGIMHNSVSLAAINLILEETLQYLGLTKYQLALLLGMGGTGSDIYKWIGGTQGPSSAYMARLVKLWSFQVQGMPVCDMSQIMWEDSLILWRDGSVTRENHIPGGSGAIPPEEGTSVWQMAQFFIKQRRLSRASINGQRRLSPRYANPDGHLDAAATDAEAESS